MGVEHIEIIAGKQREHPLGRSRCKRLPEVQQSLDMGGMSERLWGEKALKMARQHDMGNIRSSE